jgi:hypothetical protein
MEILKNFDNWALDVFGIENPRNELSGFKNYFDFIIKNHNRIQGDIAEFGVFNGKSLLATALILKELKSKKKIYGFDSFKGLANFHKNDGFKLFNDQYKKKEINKKNFQDHKKLVKFKLLHLQRSVTPQNISTSLAFANSNLKLLKQKIKYLKLNNIVIIKGDFKNTLCDKKIPFKKLMAVNMDCDLYESYNQVLFPIHDYLAKNSMISLDEYYSLKFPGPRKSVNEFLKKNKDYFLKSFNKKFCFPRYYLIKK